MCRPSHIKYHVIVARQLHSTRGLFFFSLLWNTGINVKWIVTCLTRYGIFYHFLPPPYTATYSRSQKQMPTRPLRPICLCLKGSMFSLLLELRILYNLYVVTVKRLVAERYWMWTWVPSWIDGCQTKNPLKYNNRWGTSYNTRKGKGSHTNFLECKVDSG